MKFGGGMADRTAPAVRAAALALALLTHGGAAGAQTQPSNLDELRQESLELVNAARAEEDLQALELEPELNEAAQAHAEDMLERGFYGHVSPEGETVMDRYVAAGGARYRLVAENIAQCHGCPVPADEASVEELHRGWMNSPEHRENILAEGLTGYGFGLAENASGTRYSVQTFAGPGQPRGLPQGAAAEPIDAEAQSELAASLINERRQEEGVAPISAEPLLIEAARRAIPDGDISEVELDEVGPLQAIVPSEARWRSYQLIVGSCGGCGAEPTDADIRFFVEEWFDNPRYRQVLMDPRLSSLGMVVEANGRGKKIAVALLAG